MALRRVQQNDHTLKMLRVINFDGHLNWGELDQYWPTNSADLAKLGAAIGMNTNLPELYIDGSLELEDPSSDKEAFFEGLQRNTSIKQLLLGSCDFSNGVGMEMSKNFVANNINLTAIRLANCNLGDGGSGVFTSAISRCLSLRVIQLKSCDVDDVISSELVSGIKGLRQLKALDLSNNGIGRTGCNSIADLLQDPDSSLQCVCLCHNNIDDECAKILAKSLKGNCNLKSLVFFGNAGITRNGLKAFSRVLCDASSINHTYLSNHKLQIIGNDNPLPSNLISLLDMNNDTDKRKVATIKILQHHHHIDMDPFLEFDLKALPLAISWFDRARSYAKSDATTNIDASKLSAIYQFAIASPLMFIPFPNKTNKKRKSEMLSE